MTQILNVIKININLFKQILTQKTVQFQNKTYREFYSDIISPKSMIPSKQKAYLKFNSTNIWPNHFKELINGK